MYCCVVVADTKEKGNMQCLQEVCAHRAVFTAMVLP